MNKRYQVFVSSTFADLKDERRKDEVKLAIFVQIGNVADMNAVRDARNTSDRHHGTRSTGGRRQALVSQPSGYGRTQDSEGPA